jgi:hypothetical protein
MSEVILWSKQQYLTAHLILDRCDSGSQAGGLTTWQELLDIKEHLSLKAGTRHTRGTELRKSSARCATQRKAAR